MKKLRGRRFDSNEVRERCFSNGPQGEATQWRVILSRRPHSKKPAFLSGLFYVCSPERMKKLREVL
jgi:hypothetical protein